MPFVPARTAGRIVLLAVSTALAACSSPTPTTPSDFATAARHGAAPPFGNGPLRLNQVQVKGTHNSYHVRSSWTPIPEWQLTHAPLDVQLESQGVRALELDTRFDEETGSVRVLHVPSFDDGTSCSFLWDCLAVVRSWSDAHPGHVPVFIQIEVKDDEMGGLSTFHDYADLLDRIILETLSRDRVITPDDVQGERSTLREAVTTTGWPTVVDSLGKVVFFLDDRSAFHDAYTREGTSCRGRVMFPQSRPEESIGGFVIENTPGPHIRDIVAHGFIVRTRADVFPVSSDVSGRRDDARRSGAQILSTDYPVARDGVPAFDLGASRTSCCNPVTGPAACELDWLEPQRIAGR